MKRVVAFIFAGIVLLLQGCATTQGRVQQFHALSDGSKTFWVNDEMDNKQSLEYRAYAAQVQSALSKLGWRAVDRAEAADLAVFVDYSVGGGREKISSVPIMGAVPTGSSYTRGSISPNGQFNAMTTQRSSLGLVGMSTTSTTVHDAYLRVQMYSVAVFNSTGKLEPVYEGRVRATGPGSDAASVVPHLISALFADFPGKSGGSREFTVHLQ